MATLPEIAIDNLSDAGGWHYRARLLFPNDVTVPLDLRLDSWSELAPRDEAPIEAQLRRHREGVIDNYLPMLDQVAAWAAEPVSLGFFL
jgi:hypothetical protein